AVGFVSHSRIVDRHLLAAWKITRDAAFNARHEQILQTRVRKRPAHHYFMISAARAVRIEVARLDAVLDEILGGWARLGDAACRRDVIGRDAVTDYGQH